MPSDRAVLDTEVRHAGGDPAKVHVVTVGFNGAQALARRAAWRRSPASCPTTAWAFRCGGHPITPFWLDRNGGPAYPGLVAFTTRRLAAYDPALVRDFLAATVRGYEDTLRDPARSLADLLRLNPSLPRDADRRLAARLPAVVRRRGASRSGRSSPRISPSCRAGCSPTA